MNKTDCLPSTVDNAAEPQGIGLSSIPEASRHGVVIVEDDPMFRQALVEVIEGAGYRSLASDRGDEILAALHQFRPDLILLDMLLPEIYGFEFLARLRNHPAGASVSVIILSNLADSLIDCIDPDAARVIGVAAIFPKSMPLPALLDQISRYLQSAALSETS